MTRVLFVVPHPIEGPSSRFRVYQFLPYLQAHGIEAEVRPLVPSRHVRELYQEGGLGRKLALTGLASLNRLIDVLRAGRFDLVYLLRDAFPFGPPLFERALAMASGRLIYDFDDAIWLPSQVYSNPLDRLRDWSKPSKVIARADHVVVGSAHLARYAQRFALDAAAVSVIPTVVDSSVYQPRTSAGDSRNLTIGWVGTPRGSQKYLSLLLPIMRDFANRYPHVNWRLVGTERFDTGDLPVEFKTWQLDQEVSDIQSFDIGLMPLTDDDFSRGKCGFKLIQYMNCGIPVVCSPIGANLDIVEANCNGLFASTPAEWSAALERLINDRLLRQTMGARGRVLAEQRYNLATQSPRLLDVIQRVSQKPRTRFSFPSFRKTY